MRPVPLPEISGFESAIRKQLKSTEKDLRASVLRSGVGDYEMSEAYGVAGRLCHVYDLVDAAEACYLNASRLRPLNFSWVYLLGRLHDGTGFPRPERTP